MLERLEVLEKRDIEYTASLVELLSAVTFFGGLKKEKCIHARNGQCSLFVLGEDASRRIPISSKCRISGCNVKSPHLHLELSNMACGFCHLYDSGNLHSSLDAIV